MQTIMDYVKNPEILQYVRLLTPDSYFGLQLFKVNRVDELSYKYIKGAYGQDAAMMAEVVGFEVSAPTVGRDTTEEVSGDIPLIKQKSRFKEEEVIKIFAPRTSRERANAIAKLYNDMANRVHGIYSRLNWIAMQAISKGSVTFISEGMKLVADWKVPVAHKAAPAKKWDAVDSTPLKDIQAMQAVFTSEGKPKPDAAITSTTVVTALLQNPSIKTAIFGTDKSDRILTLPVLNQFLVASELPEIYVYDNVARVVDPSDLSTTTTRYFDEKTFTLIPRNVTLGETLIGPTAEAIRSVGVEEAPGIYGEVFETKDPVNVWTYAVASGFITFPGADLIGIMTVLP